MKMIIALLFFLLAGFASAQNSGTGITEKNWRILSIIDYTNKRELDCSGADSYLYFGNKHVSWYLCGTSHGTYLFNRPGHLQLSWSEGLKDSCDLLHQQMAWYGRYRMNALLYNLEGDTLEMSHASGVRYKLVAQPLPILPKK